MQYPYTPSADTAFAISQVGTAAVVAAAVFGRSRLLAAGLGVAAIGSFTSLREWAAWLVLALAVGAGALLRAESTPEATPPFVRERRLGLLAFAAAALTSLIVFRRYPSMDEEWAFSFQADVFAHLRAFAPAPPCTPVFESPWIYFWQGRWFTQFTPGWPLALAPFSLLGLSWLGSPVALGLMVVGVSRLAQRAHSPRAGVAAAVIAMASAAALLNGGSRFSHIFVGALFAWAVESACAVADRPSVKSALILGTCLALLPATRPGDGLCLAPPVLVWAVWSLRSRRRVLAIAAGVAMLWTLLTLVILRAQLGVWFRTGYALTELMVPWSRFGMSAPKLHELAEAVPLGAMSYCFWPCAPAIGVAGLLVTRARALRWMLGAGALCLVVFYAFVEFTRIQYWGYGPRYHVPLLVPFAVGGGVLFARIDRAAVRHALTAIAALVTVWLGVYLYPVAHAEAYARASVERAIDRRGLANAVVTVEEHEVGRFPIERTHNLGEIHDQSVLIVLRGTPADRRCLKDAFPDRRLYRALGRGEVTLVEDDWP